MIDISDWSFCLTCPFLILIKLKIVHVYYSFYIIIPVIAILISFFVLETASFLGIIGEPGESLLDWVDDEVERAAPWTGRLARWHKAARQQCNLQVLENLYEACVDEEKIASFGFSVGTVCALLTWEDVCVPSQQLESMPASSAKISSACNDINAVS